MKTIMAGIGLTAATIAIAISASPNHPMQPTRAPLQPVQQTVQPTQPAQPLQTTVSRDPGCRWGIDCPMETWPPAAVETPHQHPYLPPPVQGPDCRDVIFGKSICDTEPPTAPTLDPGIIHDSVV